MEVLGLFGSSINIKGALCSFGENIFIRIDYYFLYLNQLNIFMPKCHVIVRKSLSLSFLCQNKLNKQTDLKIQYNFIINRVIIERNAMDKNTKRRAKISKDSPKDCWTFNFIELYCIYMDLRFFRHGLEYAHLVSVTLVFSSQPLSFEPTWMKHSNYYLRRGFKHSDFISLTPEVMKGLLDLSGE